jgi:signal transduction histidine kinase
LNERLLEELAHMEELASMGQASAEFVHDLRNPLTIVLGYVELLNQQLQGVRDLLGGHYEDTLRYLEVINSNADRCKQLADAWQGAGEHAGEMEPVGIADLLRSVREGIEFLAAGRHAAVDFEVGINGTRVKANRSQLLRAVHNVVSNAIQAVPESGGFIRVTGRQSEDWVEIEVEDNGCGIPEDIRTRIFEPYFTTKAEGEGTGLGLAITKRIVEDFDGTLSVESEPGRGTSVRLRLPAMRR